MSLSLPNLPPVDLKEGLSELLVREQRDFYGPNLVARKARVSAIGIFLSQFYSPLIVILLVAFGVTYLQHEIVDALVILVAVILNTILGFWQEYRAQRGLEALTNLLSPHAHVLRNGSYSSIPSSELVPGDLVLLQAGESISADGVLLDSKGLVVNESVLTGESLACAKKSLPTSSSVAHYFVPIQERSKNTGAETVYMGTTVLAGTGLMRVVFTGAHTEVGAIAHTLAHTIDGETPLQKKLKNLSYFLTGVVLFFGTVIFLFGRYKGVPFNEIFSLSVAVAVSAIPEGLAISLTAILAISMQRILKQKALVRKLLAAEVLGSVSVICCDKTGTLTEGQMRVVSYESDDRQKLLLAALLGNSLYDPVDVGMWEWAKNTIQSKELSSVNSHSVEELCTSHPLIDQLPFDPNLRYAVRLFDIGRFVVGAPETVLAYCDMSMKEKKRLEDIIGSLALKGLRVVGFGFSPYKKNQKLKPLSHKDELTYLGFLAYEDPVRIGVKEAIQNAEKAGISVKVITGDFRNTAQAVMKQLGFKISDSQIIDGQDLERMTARELQKTVRDVRLFARTTPSQKLKIVTALQARGEVVAMTGDGVNDAPALKKSDIGVVVSSASDVSKETADVVLLDNNFSTILAAVEEGRGIFGNLKKIVLYLLGNAFSETLLVMTTLFIGMPLPVTSAQILWINLVDDGLPNLALTLDPKEKGLLRQKPKKRHSPIVDWFMSRVILLASLTTAVVVFLVFLVYYQNSSYYYAQTMAFTTLAVSTLFYSFSARSLEKPLWKEGIRKNTHLLGAVFIGLLLQMTALYIPFFQSIFKTVALGIIDWVVVFLASMTVLVVIEILKYVFLLFDASYSGVTKKAFE